MSKWPKNNGRMRFRKFLMSYFIVIYRYLSFSYVNHVVVLFFIVIYRRNLSLFIVQFNIIYRYLLEFWVIDHSLS